jgi:flagellar basal-body rod protein FlgC
MAGENGAGVVAHVTENQEGYVPAYDPTSIYANNDGIVAAPAVDLTEESINILVAKSLYKANVAVIKASDKMLDDLLDVIA